MQKNKKIVQWEQLKRKKKMGDSSGCSAATGTGRAKWIILHTKLDEDEKGFRVG